MREGGCSAFDVYYEVGELWPEASLRRLRAVTSP
jgi:hypothetical protein